MCQPTKGGVLPLCQVLSDLSGLRKEDLKKDIAESKVDSAPSGPRAENIKEKTARLGRKLRAGLRSKEQKVSYYGTFEIRVTGVSAGLTFELWHNGKRYSRNDRPIEVKWNTDGNAAAQVVAGSAQS